MTTDLQVIGTGFGRTGTDSMREALEILGFGPCHHMRNLIADENHKQRWRDFVAGQDVSWDVILTGCKSCVDWPSAHFWPELIENHPDAKVLLTWRTADSWWKSFSNTILPIIEKTAQDPNQPPGSQLVSQTVFGGKPLTREHCIATYEANVANVKATVPTHRLLVYKIGDGWEPLCAHLGVPVPNQPFPRSNSTAEFKTDLGKK
jgi:hypothetical protein